VSHVTTGRGAYERGDYRRGADAYGRAQQRARALDDADTLAISAVNRATALVAAGRAAEALAGLDEALADARIEPARRAELLVAARAREHARASPLRRWSPVARRWELKPAPALQAQALLGRAARNWRRTNPRRARALAGMRRRLGRPPGIAEAERPKCAPRSPSAEKKKPRTLCAEDKPRTVEKGGPPAEMAAPWPPAARGCGGRSRGAADRLPVRVAASGAQGLRPVALACG
jgi:hypothetical protein